MVSAGIDGVTDLGSFGGTVVYNPKVLKSADPVTYDNAGNIIPLSERFNPKSDDIRYMPAGKEFVSDVKESRKGVTLGNMKPGFHFSTKFIHILQHLGWEKPKGPPPDYGFPNFSKPGAKKIEKFLVQQMSDLVESLPQDKQVNAQTGKTVDPYFVVKKHFPKGEKGDVSQIIKNISDAMYTAEIRTVKSSQSDVHNLLEMAENLGVKIDAEVADVIAARAYGKGKSYKEHKADAAKALAELTNPEFYDVQKMGKGAALATKIRTDKQLRLERDLKKLKRN
jgi:hypothetical protein